ncbi:MAG: M28 family metallopeptidase [Acidobacteriota bacterium]
MHLKHASVLAIILLAATATACSGPAGEPPVPEFSEAAIAGHVKILASDEFEGRFPGTKGEDLTITYIADQFKAVGLKPGSPDGTYFQDVPLVGITADPSTALTFATGVATRTLRFKDDVVAWTKRVQDEVRLDASDVVFVGYGVHAPEYGWDDYKGTDVSGKTLVMLVNDPPVPDPATPGQLDPKTFGGRAMTYYGRWTYKYEVGAEKKAAAVFIVHETEPAAYPFSVVQGKTGEQFDLVAPDKNMSRVAVEGWITHGQAIELFKMAGLDYEKAKAAAATREFRPIPMGVTASMTIRNTIRTIDSRNVVGTLEGSDPALKHEYVIYTSHWDHFGIGDPVDGDTIYNGALDNASGIGGLIELGRAFAALEEPPKRSILFLAVTAEEQGLLGSDYYARMPLYPLEKTLAVVNMDSLNIYGKTSDLRVVGLGHSDLDDYATRAAAAQNRTPKPDPEPERGGYFRSDHFPFAKQGVPAINAGGGNDFIGRPADYGKQVRDAYTSKHYHQPSDEYRPDWDLSGAVQDLQIYFDIAYHVANAETFPAWKAGSEFKSKREKMLAPGDRR